MRKTKVWEIDETLRDISQADTNKMVENSRKLIYGRGQP